MSVIATYKAVSVELVGERLLTRFALVSGQGLDVVFVPSEQCEYALGSHFTLALEALAPEKPGAVPVLAPHEVPQKIAQSPLPIYQGTPEPYAVPEKPQAGPSLIPQLAPYQIPQAMYQGVPQPLVGPQMQPYMVPFVVPQQVSGEAHATSKRKIDEPEPVTLDAVRKVVEEALGVSTVHLAKGIVEDARPAAAWSGEAAKEQGEEKRS